MVIIKDLLVKAVEADVSTEGLPGKCWSGSEVEDETDKWGLP